MLFENKYVICRQQRITLNLILKSKTVTVYCKRLSVGQNAYVVNRYIEQNEAPLLLMKKNVGDHLPEYMTVFVKW